MHTDLYMAHNVGPQRIPLPPNLEGAHSAAPSTVPLSSLSSSAASSSSSSSYASSPAPSLLSILDKPVQPRPTDGSATVRRNRKIASRRFHDGRDCLFGISSCPGCKYSESPTSARSTSNLEDNQGNDDVNYNNADSASFDLDPNDDGLSHGDATKHRSRRRRLRHRHGDSEVRAHRQFFFQSMLGLDVATAIKSPAANRSQLVASFLNDMNWVDAIQDKYQYMGVVHDWFHSPQPLATAATDSVLITHLAHLTKDDRFLDEVRRAQAVAVAALQKALQKPHAAQDDAILAAADALGIRQMYYKGTSPRLADNLARLLTAAGPSQLGRRSIEQPDLTFSIAHVIVTAGLINRRTCLFSDPQWYGVLEDKCRGRVWCLLHLQARIPKLLDLVDNVDHMSRSQANSLFAQLIAVDRLLHKWLIAWYNELPGEIIWTTSITNLNRFVADYGPVVEAFPRVFQFQSLLVALGHLYYWTTIYWVREALWRLVSKHRSLFPDTPDPVAWSLTRVNECVDSLCRTIPFILGEPQSANPGMIRLASNWYRRTGEHTKVAFCEAILNKAVMASFQFETQRQASDPEYYVGANSFIFRRIICNRVIGPSHCCMRAS